MLPGMGSAFGLDSSMWWDFPGHPYSLPTRCHEHYMLPTPKYTVTTKNISGLSNVPWGQNNSPLRIAALIIFREAGEKGGRKKKERWTQRKCTSQDNDPESSLPLFSQLSHSPFKGLAAPRGITRLLGLWTEQTALCNTGKRTDA